MKPQIRSRTSLAPNTKKLGIVVALIAGISVASQHPLPISFEVSTNSIQLEWDAVPGAVDYRVLARHGNSDGTIIVDTKTDKTSFNINDLKPNTEVLVQVNALGNFQALVGSTKAIKTSQTDIATPRNLRTLEVEPTTVAVSWAPVAAAEGYVLEIQSLSQDEQNEPLIQDSVEVAHYARSMTFAGLLPDQFYTIHLSAKDVNGISRPAILPVKTQAQSSSMGIASAVDTSIEDQQANSLVVANLPPRLLKASKDIQLTKEQSSVGLDLQKFFIDPENGPIVFTAYPVDPSVVSTSGDDRLILNALSDGRTLIHVTATDLRGESTSEYIAVEVNGIDGQRGPYSVGSDSGSLAQHTTFVTQATPLVLGTDFETETRFDDSFELDVNTPLASVSSLTELGIGREYWSVENVGIVDAPYNNSEITGPTSNPSSYMQIVQRLGSEVAESLDLPLTNEVRFASFSEMDSVKESLPVQDESTLAAAAGLRLQADRLSVEAQGRIDGMYSVDTREENRFSVRATLNVSQDGTGLSLAVAPSWAKYATIQEEDPLQNSNFLARRITPYTPEVTSTDVFTVNTRIGYGFRLADTEYLLTPFLDADLSDVNQQRKLLGMRLDAFENLEVPFSLDFAVGIMEREQDSSGIANLKLSLKF